MANMSFSESIKEVHADIGALLRELASAQEEVSDLIKQVSDAERTLLDKEAKERTVAPYQENHSYCIHHQAPGK